MKKILQTPNFILKSSNIKLLQRSLYKDPKVEEGRMRFILGALKADVNKIAGLFNIRQIL